MGAWGIGTFDNDDASDWPYDLEGSEGTVLIEESLDRVLAEEDYLESPDCANALAAAEMGGILKAHSDGKDKGATLTLTLPVIVPVEHTIPSV